MGIFKSIQSVSFFKGLIPKLVFIAFVTVVNTQNNTDFVFLFFFFQVYLITLWSSSSLSLVGGFVLLCASIMFAAWPQAERKKDPLSMLWPLSSCKPNEPFLCVRFICHNGSTRSHIFFLLPCGNVGVS